MWETALAPLQPACELRLTEYVQNRIKLLPDAIANQIAAGEVIQRPASAVKELLENSIDAKAQNITLTVKDAGKTLIHIADDGIGMNDSDARMCFERHATSKISVAEDLWTIQSYGFRGEAMPSIAAISQVRLQSCPEGQQIGTDICVEGGVFKSQTSWAGPQGTRITVSNLFYNTPARRNFLKSESLENANILKEVLRVAFAYPDRAFTYINGQNAILTLREGTLKQRCAAILPAGMATQLVPVEEQTSIISVHGLVGKPQIARRRRGEQYLFVNRRFIRDAALHQAVLLAFQDLLPADHHPVYVLHLTMPPEDVDVNIHPTKTEVKFRDDRAMFAVLRAAIKHSLSQFAVAPSIDFTLDPTILAVPALPNGPITAPGIRVNPDYNPFDSEQNRERNYRMVPTNWGDTPDAPLVRPNWQLPGSSPADALRATNGASALPWEHLPEGVTLAPDAVDAAMLPMEGMTATLGQLAFSPLGSRYAVATQGERLWLLDADAATEAIYYDVLMRQGTPKMVAPQALMFPSLLSLTVEEQVQALQMRSTLGDIGLVLQLTPDGIALIATPADLEVQSAEALLAALLAEAAAAPEADSEALDLTHHWARRAAARMPRHRQRLTATDAAQLAHRLFTSAQPYFTAGGRPTVLCLAPADFERLFRASAAQ